MATTAADVTVDVEWPAPGSRQAGRGSRLRSGRAVRSCFLRALTRPAAQRRAPRGGPEPALHGQRPGFGLPLGRALSTAPAPAARAGWAATCARTSPDTAGGAGRYTVRAIAVLVA